MRVRSDSPIINDFECLARRELFPSGYPDLLERCLDAGSAGDLERREKRSPARTVDTGPPAVFPFSGARVNVAILGLLLQCSRHTARLKV